MKRIFAHKIIYDGIEYAMSVATLDGNRILSIEPFERETEATVFLSGVVRLVRHETDIEIIPVQKND